MNLTQDFMFPYRLDDTTRDLIFIELVLCRSIAAFCLQSLFSFLINTFEMTFRLLCHILPYGVSLVLNIRFLVSIGKFHGNVSLEHLQLYFSQLNILIWHGKLILLSNCCFWMVFQLVSLLIAELSLNGKFTKFIQHVLSLLESQFVCCGSILVNYHLRSQPFFYTIWHCHGSSHLWVIINDFLNITCRKISKIPSKDTQNLFLLFDFISVLIDFYQTYDHNYSQFMYKNMRRTLLLFLAITSIVCEQIATNNLKSEGKIHQSLNQQTQLKSEGDSFLSNPLVIALIVIVSFNIFVFILVYGCRRCFRLPYQVNMAHARQHAGTKYPNVKFETASYCLIQEEKFWGRDCYQREQIINTLPAYIYGRQIDAQISHLDYFTLRQCQKCGGFTRTLEIFKYGKLRECWETLFMIVISPCFLAFTIHRITANSILWRKFFCTECGYEKRARQ